MTYRTVSVAAKTIALSMAAAVALAFAPHAFAQQPSTKSPAPPVQAAPKPDAAKAPPVAPGEAAQNEGQVQLIYSPWTKHCANGPSGKSSEIPAKEVCFTLSDGHTPSGQKLIIALLIEPKGVDEKLFRVTLPLGVALIPGARLAIDEKEAMVAPYVICLPKNGCIADREADADFIAKLKKGRSLTVEAFDKGKPISFTLPLAEFAKAYDGPPGDSAGLSRQKESLPDELQRHTEDHPGTPGGK